MKALLTTTALIEAGAGVALIARPSTMVTLLLGFAPDSGTQVMLIQVAGAVLLALGLACGLTKDDDWSPTVRVLTITMVLYNFGIAVILAVVELGWGWGGILLWPAVLLHTVMGAWCVGSLKQHLSSHLSSSRS